MLSDHLDRRQLAGTAISKNLSIVFIFIKASIGSGILFPTVGANQSFQFELPAAGRIGASLCLHGPRLLSSGEVWCLCVSVVAI